MEQQLTYRYTIRKEGVFGVIIVTSFEIFQLILAFLLLLLVIVSILYVFFFLL